MLPTQLSYYNQCFYETANYTTLSECNNKFSDFMLVMTVIIETVFPVHCYRLVKSCYVRIVRIFNVAPI